MMLKSAQSSAGTEFVPQLDEGDLVVQPSRHPDVSLEEAIAQAGRVERAAMTVPEVLGATSRIGSPTVATDTMGIEQSDVFLRLLDDCTAALRLPTPARKLFDTLGNLLRGSVIDWEGKGNARRERATGGGGEGEG